MTNGELIRPKMKKLKQIPHIFKNGEICYGWKCCHTKLVKMTKLK